MPPPEPRPDDEQPMSGQLDPRQAASLSNHLEALMAQREMSPAEILIEIESWAMAQDDPAVNQWLWNRQAEANGTTRRTHTSSGYALRDHFNQIGARHLSYHQAAHFGVELVHHPDSDRSQVFHTADGDIVYIDGVEDRWEVVENGRKGIPLISGEMARKHQPYTHRDARIHHTAIVDDTATIEPGARIGPHATVGEHAHIGVDATIASYTRVEDGAFVGSFASVRDGSRIGPGAVVGTGATVGSTANIGSGARIAQNTRIDAFDNVAVNSHIGGSSPRPSRERNGYRASQIASAVDRLAQLDRD